MSISVIIVKTFRHYDPEQVHLLPEDPRTWLPDGHLVFFIDDVVDRLDLSAITRPYEAEERGYPPYHPVMMVKILLYAYCVGVFSSRKIMHRLHEDVAFRILSGDNQPDFRTVSEFRKRHLAALEGLFDQVLRLCMEAGLVKLGHVSIDGTKVMANASRHKAMSYGRMKKELDRLRAEAKALLAEAERVDTEEDAIYGDKSGFEMPEALADPKRRRKIIEEALAAVRRTDAERAQDAEAEAKGAEEGDKESTPKDGTPPGGDEASPDAEAEPFTGLPEGELLEELERRTGRMERILGGKHALEERAREKAEGKESGDTPPGAGVEASGQNSPPEGETSEERADGAQGHPMPKDKDQYNFTDPESRIMPDSGNKKAFIQGYNGLLVADEENQIIVATGVVPTSADCPQLPDMMDRMEEALGKRPKKLSGDTGFYSERNVDYLRQRGIDAYIPPEKQKHAYMAPKAPRGRIPKGLSQPDRMRRKLRTKAGKKVYSRRKVIVEPPIGQIKQARGFRRFSMRGQEKARGEWAIVGMTHNILRWHAVVGWVR